MEDEEEEAAAVGLVDAVLAEAVDEATRRPLLVAGGALSRRWRSRATLNVTNAFCA